MKMNKKGFTLIELLAVIVILAVIALIAVPQILNILNNARKSAAQDSAYGILKAAETYATNYMLDNNGNALADGTTFTCNETNKGCKISVTATTGVTLANSGLLDFKGTKPTDGTVKLDGKGNAYISAALKINGFSCTTKSTTDATDTTVTCS